MGSAVLIADRDPERARRLAKECEARGFQVRLAHEGPAALEMALTDIPDVLVMRGPLPLISAQQLNQILRSNPRTQGIPFFLLGVPGSVDGDGAADEQMPLDANDAEVAKRLDSVLARRSRRERVRWEAGAENEISGKLVQVSLPDLLQLLQLNQRTGVVDVVRRTHRGREERGTVFVRDGNVIQAQSGRVEAEKALFRLLAWRDGSFAFRPSLAPVPERISTPTRALLLEGARHLDEWERVCAQLPSLQAQVTLLAGTADLPNSIQPLTQEVLLLLEIYSRVGDVVDHCTYPDYQVLRTLQTLVNRSLVEITESPEGRSGPGPFSPLQVRRLQDWIRADSRRAGHSPDAKVVLVSTSLEATQTFLDGVGRLAGVQRQRAAPMVASDLQSVARITVAPELGIEILHVPASREYEAVWRLAGHRALAVVLLLDGVGEAATELLRGCGRVLGSLARIRAFHLVLQQENEKIELRVARVALGLEEDAWLAILKPGDGEDPEPVLYDLLSGLMP